MRREFLDWSEPALPRAARRLLEASTSDGVARLDDALVVLPGQKAGRRLKELLVEAAAEDGARLLPPRVVTVGGLPEQLYQPPGPLASDAVSRLAWAQTLRAAPAHRLELVFRRRPDEPGAHQWTLLARELRRLHREVARGGHRFGDVSKRCRDAAASGRLSWSDADRWGVLAELQHEYAAELGRAGLLDRDLARMEAIEEGRLEAPGDVWLIGVSEMPEVTRRALEAVRERVRVLIHSPEERADAFDAFGCVVPEAWEEVEVPLGNGQIDVVDEPGDQADVVAHLLADLAGARTAEEIVVGVPDPEVVPWIEERLTDAGVPVRDAAGIPVQATAPYRLVATAVEFLETRRYESFAALVRHPDVSEWLADRPATRDELARPGGWLEPLDEWYGEHLPARLPPPSAPLPGAKRGSGPVVDALRTAIDDELLLPLREAPAERALSEWTGPLLQVLEAVYRGRELRQSRPRDRRLIRALEALAAAGHAFDDLPDTLDVRCTSTGALRTILEEAQGATIAPEAVRAAVELLGWLELHLDDAPETVLTGANEPRLPESVTADAFLPDALRRELGLLDNRTRYARDAYRLTAMIHSTGTLHVIAGRRSAAGDPLRPSRLLLAADPQTVARRVADFYGVDLGGEAEGPTESGGGGTPDQAPSAFRLPPEPELRLPEPVESLRVTEFSTLLTDPYGWALARLHEAECFGDDAREMDGPLFGKLVHEVLEDFGKDTELTTSTDPGRIRRALDDLLDTQVARRFGSEMAHTHPAVRLQVEQLRARLHRFAEWHADWIGEGWEVRGVEVGTPDGGSPFDVDGEPIGLRARIDRIDHHPGTDRWAVFDYKTRDRGDPPEKTHRKGPQSQKEWIDLQLPLYGWLLGRLTDQGGAPRYPGAGAPVQVGYILLPRALEDVGDSLAEWGDAEMEDAIETAREVVRRVREGVFRFDPAQGGGWPNPEMDALLGLDQLTATGADGEDAEDDG